MIDVELVAKGEQCGTCGLKQSQVPPVLRFVRSDGGMYCLHNFTSEQIAALPDPYKEDASE
jgi:hypothetical protein